MYSDVNNATWWHITVQNQLKVTKLNTYELNNHASLMLTGYSTKGILSTNAISITTNNIMCTFVCYLFTIPAL